MAQQHSTQPLAVGMLTCAMVNCAVLCARVARVVDTPTPITVTTSARRRPAVSARAATSIQAMKVPQLTTPVTTLTSHSDMWKLRWICGSAREKTARS